MYNLSGRRQPNDDKDEKIKALTNMTVETPKLLGMKIKWTQT